MQEVEMDNALSEFLEYAPTKGPRCWWHNVSGKLDAKDLKTVGQAFAQTEITSKAISKWLEKRGVLAESGSIARHRRGDCGCKR